jgi:ATP phosphoribosyltransferase regulatory subunit HisZ
MLEKLRPTLDLGIGAYTLPVALEKIRRLSKALDDALAAWEADRARIEALEYAKEALIVALDICREQRDTLTDALAAKENADGHP